MTDSCTVRSIRIPIAILESNVRCQMQWSLAHNWEAQCASSVTPLHLASHNGNVGGLRVLLGHGTQVHIRDDEGLTPLRRVLPHLGKDVGDVFFSKILTLL